MQEYYHMLESLFAAASRGEEVDEYDTRRIARMLAGVCEVLGALADLAGAGTMLPAGFPRRDDVYHAYNVVNDLRSAALAAASPPREETPRGWV